LPGEQEQVAAVATRQLEGGLDIRRLQELLGRSIVETTQELHESAEQGKLRVKNPLEL